MRRRTFVGALAAATLGASPAPLRLAMAGLVHGHAAGFLGRYQNRADIDLVGIAEPDRDVAARYLKQFHLDPATIDHSVEAMLDRARPQGVVVFTNTTDHLSVVEACARRKIPVMMEKPLAASDEHARAIERAARAAGIPVLVNYETTWYPCNRAAWSVIKEAGSLGEVRKVVIHDGHRGPKEIGVQPEFLAWLSDPRSGGGALFDFGCYGANLMTWLMDNQQPRSVTAVTQQLKPEVYPRVEDEATIILSYPHAQAIIQASWNWPFDRKDMEVYGRTGSLRTEGAEGLRVRLTGKPEESRVAAPIPAPDDDFLRYFSAVVRGQIQPSGLSSLANNVIVTRILAAAARSAASGKTVHLEE